MSSNNKNQHDSNSNLNFKRWGQMKLEKLADDIDINRLRQARPILVDEPLISFPSFIQNNNDLFMQNIELKPVNNQKRQNESKSTIQIQTVNLQPTIDSYIINTIKLNRILSNNLTFEQIEYFTTKSSSTKTKLSKSKKKQQINSDEEARHALKQFIIIMSLHCGFTQASSLALDILVEVLEDYISAFFKLLKNLKQIHQVDLNKSDPKTSLVQYNHYSSELFMKQAFDELGIGSVDAIRNFYQNDIINYHQETFKKVTKLYDDYKARKLAEKLKREVKNNTQTKLSHWKTEGEIKVEEFIRENDFLNDESNMILDELLTDLNETHFDEGMTRLLQMIGTDPFALMPDDHL